MALNTAWIWSSLDRLRGQRRTDLVSAWKKAANKEKEVLKAKEGRVLIHEGPRKSRLLDHDWHDHLEEMKQNLKTLQSDAQQKCMLLSWR